MKGWDQQEHATALLWLGSPCCCSFCLSMQDLTVVMVAPKCPGTEVREDWHLSSWGRFWRRRGHGEVVNMVCFNLICTLMNVYQYMIMQNRANYSDLANWSKALWKQGKPQNWWSRSTSVALEFPRWLRCTPRMIPRQGRENSRRMLVASHARARNEWGVAKGLHGQNYEGGDQQVMELAWNTVKR